VITRTASAVKNWKDSHKTLQKRIDNKDHNFKSINLIHWKNSHKSLKKRFGYKETQSTNLINWKSHPQNSLEISEQKRIQ
jgi:hypothetical protein